MAKWLLRLAAGLSLGLGIGFQISARSRPDPPVVRPVLEDPLLARAGTGEVEVPNVGTGSDKTLSIDVSGLAPRLNGLIEDERPEQVADWAVYGMLTHLGRRAEDLRDLTYDTAPIRDPSLCETLNFDYGPGRRVIIDDEEAWLFHFEDDPRPTATLGRLADRVRMELGEVPRLVRIYGIRPDLRNDVIHVTHEADHDGDALFSAEFGYVEQDVDSLEGLRSWLDAIDDVTHMELMGDGTVRLGGRRFDGARTPGASIDDVAALFQAHLRIAENHEWIDDAARPLTDAYDGLIDVYNANVGLYNINNYATLDATAFSNRLDAVRQALGDMGAAVDLPPEQPSSDDSADESLQSLFGGRKSGRSMSSLLVFGSPYASIDAQERAIEALEPAVITAMREAEARQLQRLIAEGGLMPDEPGFSLDPHWDLAGLVIDLNLLLERPESIDELASQVLAESDSASFDDAALPVSVRSAYRLSMPGLFGEPTETTIPGVWRDRIAQVIDAIDTTTTGEEEKLQIVPFLLLLRDLGDSDDEETVRLKPLIDFIRTRHQFQTARYDGPLQGTRVGMVLFYTDLLAKLWESVDYYRSAPIDHVPGFLSGPRTARYIEPMYWDEMVRLSSTRIWFGPRPDGYKVAESGAMNFAHIGTRVYAAGTDPLAPGEEEQPAEDARRTFGWWDRHFAEVADFEPMYHLQNQIMKWSILTGMIAEEGRFTWLDEPGVVVDRSHRFDRWYRETEGLRFQDDLPFLPEDLWADGVETLELLQSYSFPQMGGTGYISGGVSLGSAESAGPVARISPKVSPTLRRSGLDYEAAAAGELRTSANSATKGAAFELKPPTTDGRAAVAVRPSDSARLRGGAVDLEAGQFELSVTASGPEGSIALHIDPSRAGPWAGEVGQLSYRGGPSGVRLGWKDGPVVGARELTEDVARLGLVDENLSSSIARSGKFSPEHEIFVVEARDGPVVLAGGSGRFGPPPSTPISPAAGLPPFGGRGPPEGPVWSIRPVAEHSSGGGEAVLRTAAADEGFFSTGMPGPGGQVRLAEAALIGESEATKTLNAAPWQRLRPIQSEGPGAMVPGRVERVFTEAGPEVTDKSFRVSTPAGEFEGYITPDAVYIKRPESGVADAAFNGLVTEEAVTSRLVHDLIAAPRAPPEAVVLGVRTPAAGRSSAATHLAGGDPRAAARALLGDVKSSGFDEAIGGYARSLRDQAMDDMLNGRPSRVRSIADDVVPTSSPDDLIYHTLSELESNRVDLAARDLARAMSGASPSGPYSNHLIRYLDDHGHHSALEYVHARLGLSEIRPELVDRVGIRAIDGKLTITVEFGPEVPRTHFPVEEVRSRAAEHPLDLYVQGGNLNLSQLDWDLAPGRSMGEALELTDVRWEYLDLGSLRPDSLAMPSRRGPATIPNAALGAETNWDRYHRYRVRPPGLPPNWDDAEPVAVLVRGCDEDDEDCGEAAPEDADAAAMVP